MSGTVDAFIPLKGHSERVPGKNLRDFGGRPLFHTIVATLQHAGSVRTIYVDTDDAHIAADAGTLDDVVVIRRRPDLIGDGVSVNLLIKAFLEAHDCEHVIQTHATNPLLRAGTVDAAVDQYFSDGSTSSLFAVTRHQARFYLGDMTAINHDPAELLPTQDLAPLYMENSNFYIFSRDGFLEHDRRVTDDTAMFEMDPIEAIDIDEERDFEMAETLLGSRPTPRPANRGGI
ncbi:MAG: acylneuraminate cytidylyltransferase family protein [Actinomycetota bacterium]|nr:acylneuraminate cytidylyltransferase family protein [Actinomycetota bacterium]